MRNTVFFLLLILGIAGFFRLWQLDSIPPGLYPDVALNGNEALETLKTGNFKVFYPENNGREGLMMWLVAFSFQIFGVSIWSIKIVAALAGIFTVFGLYLLVKQILSEKIALLAGFFLATSFWHVNFSRLGFRAVLLPLFSVFAFYFLFRGFKTKKVLDFLLSALFFGLGFYTYTPYRLLVLLLPFLLICLPFLKNDKKTLLNIGVWLLVIFVVALPLGLYFFSHPQDFASRATGVSIFAAENPIRAFGQSLLSHLAMFNFRGDPNWRHNFSESPMLPWLLGILFLIGVLFSIKEIVVSVKNKNHQRLMSPLFLLSWFFAMLLPGVLTFEGIPHALRVVGVIPAVYIFVGLGAWRLFDKLEPIVKNRKALIATGYLALLALGFAEFNKYFFVWAKNPNVQGAFTKDYVEVGNYLNSLPDDIRKYVIVNEGGVKVPLPDGIPMPAQTPMFVESAKYGRLRAIYLLPEDLSKIEDKENAVIVPLKK